jgi:hypothetical protein
MEQRPGQREQEKGRVIAYEDLCGFYKTLPCESGPHSMLI